MKPYSVDEKKWRSFSVEMQMKNIAAEFSRAARAGIGGHKGQKEQEVSAYERAIALIDATIADQRWGNNRTTLYRLRDVAASLYARGGDPAVCRFVEYELVRGGLAELVTTSL